MRVIVLNPGSSTLKAALVIDGRREGDELVVEWPAGRDDARAVVAQALEAVPGEADAVGYRVVHGGDQHGPALVDDVLLDTVDALDALAPLHNRRAAAVMRASRAARPDLPHVACFDSAFHATLPEEGWRYPLPAEWVERWGIRRYGFHGLSVAWSCRRAAELLGREPNELRLVVAHLGSGCSVTAVDGGRSVDTSMGYTPYEGLMMGTRSGSIDPGILLRLSGSGLGTDELADGLAHRSGLQALAGSSDVREIEARAGRGDRDAILALGLFCRRAAAAVAAASTALSRLDGVVFTGGIGANSTAVRADVARRLAVIGVPEALATGTADCVAASGPPAVLVVRAREDLVIAGEVEALLA
jgi:acetate kinase